MSVTAAKPQAAETAAQERLSPLERLEALCDPGTFKPIRSGVDLAEARRARSCRRRRRRRDRPRRRAADRLLRAGRRRSSAARSASAHADTIVRVLQLAGRSRGAGRRLRRVRRRADAGGHGGARRLRADLPPHGRADRRRPADLDRLRRLGRRRRVLAGADRLDRDDRGRRDVPDRPGVVREALGEEIDAAALGGRGCTTATASATWSSRRRARRGGGVARAAVLPAVSTAGAGAAAHARARARARPTRARVVPADAAQRLRRARRAARDRRRRLAARAAAALGAQRRHRASRASTAGRSAIVANQPRYLGGVLDAEASEKARAVRRDFCDSFGVPLIAVVDTPGFMPGSRQEQAGRDPPRRVARARVRGGDGAEADRGPAQVLRRRLHHDELAGPRRRPGARVARGRAGDHGRAAGGRDRQPPRAGGGGGSERGAGALAAAYAEEHLRARTSPRPPASSTR